MKAALQKSAPHLALSVLPAPLCREINALAEGRVGGISSLREIRVRSRGISTAQFASAELRLLTKVSEEELYKIVGRITDTSLYAHRDTIRRGYVSMGMGIRVGVCGHARYDGECPTVSDITSLVFRIPSGNCEISEQLYSAYKRASSGVLIYSPPGVGKTTALRSLAGNICRRDGIRIVVVDERSELVREDFENLPIDIVSGYSRREGIALAVRTLGAQLVMVDELMGDECAEIEYSLLSGIPVIATAHAGSLSELLSKRELARLVSLGAFSTFIGISRSGGRYSVDVSEDGDGCLSISEF